MSKKKEMIGVKIGVNTKKVLKGLANGLEIELSGEITRKNDSWLSKCAGIGEQVLSHMGDCLKEMSEDRRLCLFFSDLLGIMPESSHESCVEVTSDNAEELLAAMDADKEVPDEVKEFLRSTVKVTKFMDKKKEGCGHEHH